MPTHTFSRSWTNGGSAMSKATSITAGAEHNLSEVIPTSTADRLIAFALDVSQAKGLYIVSDKDLLLETNSSGSPTNVFTLAAGVPYVWVYGDAPIRDTAGTAVSDITALYATNASPDDDATLQIGCLVDPTV